MISLSTIKLLREWARWGQMQNISYPSMSPMFGERALKTPLFGGEHIPDDVYRIEQAVCRLPFEERDLIIARYQMHLTFVEMGQRIGRSRWAARRRLQGAEELVHTLYSLGLETPCQRAPTTLYFDPNQIATAKQT